MFTFFLMLPSMINCVSARKECVEICSLNSTPVCNLLIAIGTYRAHRIYAEIKIESALKIIARVISSNKSFLEMASTGFAVFFALSNSC